MTLATYIFTNGDVFDDSIIAKLESSQLTSDDIEKIRELLARQLNFDIYIFTIPH